jgi:hypothetical protein
LVLTAIGPLQDEIAPVFSGIPNGMDLGIPMQTNLPMVGGMSSIDPGIPAVPMQFDTQDAMFNMDTSSMDWVSPP